MKKLYVLLILVCFSLLLDGCSSSRDAFDEAEYQNDLSYIKQFYYDHSEEFNQVAACFWEDETIECVRCSDYVIDENGDGYYTDVAILDTAKGWVDDPQEAFPSLYAAAKAVLVGPGLTYNGQFYMQRNYSDVVQYIGTVGRYANEYYTNLVLMFSKHEFTEEDLSDGWLRYSEQLDENCWLIAVDTSLPG